MAPENYASLFYSCKPQFFKVMFPDPFAKLTIPRNFHMNLPHKLQKMATLFIPNGKLWHVEICRTGQDIYFKKGWSEFAKAYDLRTGYFLVFRYEGNMIFKVKIFDTSGCLKNYSLASHERPTSAYIEIETSSQTGAQTPKEISHEITSNAHGKRRKLTNGGAQEIAKSKEASTSQKILPEKKSTKSRIDSTTSSRQFEKILRPYSCFRGFLCLPRAFCVKNDLVTNRTIFLQRKLEEEGNAAPAKWSVGLNCSPSHYRFQKGWEKFSTENNLKIGDRCTFQLVSKDTFIVQTMPFESLSIGTEDKLRPTISSTKKQIASERKDPKNNLQCERIIKGYYFDKLVSLPNSFCKANGLTSKQTIFLKRSIDGKAWSIGFRPYIKEGRFSAGWKDFARENALQEGDKCTFQFMSESTFHVKIARKRREREITSDTHAKRRKLTNGEAKEIAKREEASTSQKILPEKKSTMSRPDSTTCSKQFEKILRPCSCFRGFLRIPKEFCVNNGLLTTHTIHLIKSSTKGRPWPVQFHLRAAYGHLGKGWKEFIEAAGLHEGDRCIFRLVSVNSLVVDVISQESNTLREMEGKVIKGSSSSAKTLKEKHVRQTNQYSGPILECGRIVRKYHLIHSYQSLAKTFCLDNNLTSKSAVTLRDQTGKEWHVKFYMNSQEGRLSSKGWADFASEHGLKEGDKCIFKLIEKDTLLIRVVKSISSSMEQLEECKM